MHIAGYTRTRSRIPWDNWRIVHSFLMLALPNQRIRTICEPAKWKPMITHKHWISLGLIVVLNQLYKVLLVCCFFFKWNNNFANIKTKEFLCNRRIIKTDFLSHYFFLTFTSSLSTVKIIFSNSRYLHTTAQNFSMLLYYDMNRLSQNIIRIINLYAIVQYWPACLLLQVENSNVNKHTHWNT